MEITYKGQDITEMVAVRTCIMRDTCGLRCDSLELNFENAAGWYKWGPEEDDEIVVTHDGYTTGTMYLYTVTPEDGRYRIIATSRPAKARGKSTKSFEKKTLSNILQTCAADSGMGSQLHGVNGGATIPYIIRNGNEECAAFLAKLLMFEGAVLKCVNGKYSAIGITYAQGLDARVTLEIESPQKWIGYERVGDTYKSVSIKTPYAEGSATDSAVKSSFKKLTFGGELPVKDAGQASRWAKGILLSKNRKSELVTILDEFNPRYTAMGRVDIEGDTDASGEWLVEEVEHDLISLESTVKLHRCVTTVS